VPIEQLERRRLLSSNLPTRESSVWEIELTGNGTLYLGLTDSDEQVVTYAADDLVDAAQFFADNGVQTTAGIPLPYPVITTIRQLRFETVEFLFVAPDEPERIAQSLNQILFDVPSFVLMNRLGEAVIVPQDIVNRIRIESAGGDDHIDTRAIRRPTTLIASSSIAYLSGGEGDDDLRGGNARSTHVGGKGVDSARVRLGSVFSSIELGRTVLE
jgi:Ca2+-binding RTX toxin-like protein